MGIPDPIAWIGAGALTRSLGLALSRRTRVQSRVWSREISRAKEVSNLLLRAEPIADIEKAVEGAQLIALAVPDTVLQSVADRVARLPGLPADALAIHFSGALASDVLEPLRSRGLSVGSFHPLQAFTKVASSPLENVTIGIEGDPSVLTKLQDLAEALRARPFVIPPEKKVLYHAAAVIASNYTVALASLSSRLLEQLGASWESAQEALIPLLGGTVRNLRETGLPIALTGPISRGDVPVVRAHLDALESHSPHIAQVYRLLGQEALRLAEQRDLSAEQVSEIEEILRDPQDRERDSK